VPAEKTFLICHSGGSRNWILLAVAGCLSLLFGGPGLLRALKNREPIAIGCNALPQSGLANRWVQVTNCQLDLTEAAANSNSSLYRPTELFVPVRFVENSTGKLQVVLQTSHPILISTFLQLQRTKSPGKAADWVLQNRELAFPKREVTGVAHIQQASSRPDLAALRDSLAEEFILVNENERPRFDWHAWLAGAGFALLSVGAFAFLRRRAALH